MRVAVVDTSCVVAVALTQAGGRAIAKRMEAFDRLLASPLLEAEARSVLCREGLPGNAIHFGDMQWILPVTSLRDEIARVLDAGYVRGADCWHLASALYVADNPSDITFLTLDAQQRKVAKALGFRV